MGVVITELQGKNAGEIIVNHTDKIVSQEKKSIYLKEKVIGAIKKEPVKVALIILMVVQFCLIAYSNLTLIGQNLDCDTGKLFNHIAEIWRQKTLFLQDWDYVSTLEFDCSSILALPFYVITNDIVLAFGMSNIVLAACFVCMIFFLFRGEDSLYPLLCVNLLLIPFRIGMLDYYNMLFFGGGQYILKVSVPILMIGVIHGLQRKIKVGYWIDRGAAAVCLAMLFLTSLSSGFYVAFCGVLPIYAVYMGYKFFRWERIPGRVWGFMFLSCILILAGWCFNVMVMGGAKGNGMTICNIYQMEASIVSCFFGIFELFGGTTEASDMLVLSLTGIKILAKWCFTVVLLISGIVYLFKCMKKRGSLRGILLISVFIWNLFVLIISFPRGGSPTYEYRYHLIGILPLICVACISLIDDIAVLNRKQQKCLYWVGFLVILFLCVASYEELYTRGEQNGDLKELCAYVGNLDVEQVYLYKGSNDADICRVLDEDTLYLCLRDEGVTWAYDYYRCYVNAPMQTENVIVVVCDSEYDFGEGFEIGEHHLRKFDHIANRSLYHFVD